MLRVVHRKANVRATELAHTPESVPSWDAVYNRATGEIEITMPCLAKTAKSKVKVGGRVVVSLTPKDLAKLQQKVQDAMAVSSACPQ